jgi:hypothetical protein
MTTKTGSSAALPARQALSLHLGLNSVNAAAYSGWDGPLSACEFDAADMAAIAKSKGIKPTVLRTKQATRAKVLTAVRNAAKTLSKGDFFFLTFSGHSGTVTRARVTADPDQALAQVDAAAPETNLVGEFKPAVILISGCRDSQTSMDGEYNGAFTEQLLKVWDEGAFKGNYDSFHARIRAALPRSQSPNLFVLGNAKSFLAQKPFTV